MIEFFSVKKTLTLMPGMKVQLSKEQATKRQQALQKHDGDDDTYIVCSPIQFKAGEKIGFTQTTDTKAFGRCLSSVTDTSCKDNLSVKPSSKKPSSSKKL